MRILEIIHKASSAKSFIVPISDRLVDAGYEVSLLFEEDAEVDVHSKAEVVHARVDLSANPAVLLASFVQLFRLMRRLRPDLVHVHQTRASVLPLLVARMLGFTTLYHNHGLPFLGYKGFLRSFLLCIEVINCSLASQALFVNRTSLELMRSMQIVPWMRSGLIGRGTICGVMPSGLNLESVHERRVGARIRFGLPQHHFIVGYVGRPVVRKGFHRMVRDWARAGLEDSQLLIAGCSMEDVHTVLPDAPGNITAFGYLNEVQDLYLACDVICLPSEHEGFPYSLLEAASCRCCLLASDYVGVSEVVQHMETGVVVHLQDEEALVVALRNLRSDPELCLALGSNAQYFVESYFLRNAVLRGYDTYFSGLEKAQVVSIV